MVEVKNDLSGFHCPDALCSGLVEKVKDVEDGRIWKCNKCGITMKGNDGRKALWEKIGEIAVKYSNDVLNGKRCES